ncbi:putative gibberellin regulated protein [Medicago truncatula]|uniref:Putative gibberellin regulated protein n=1 Tax=Medicago truncatula TaxID=3880 RepID=A0A396HPD5_MEDTR|nr:putative gibberellin regulated protein [Medicago truncatula]
MAKLVCAFLFMLVTSFVIQDVYVKCSAACDVRCSATMYKKACLTYCNYCCAKCLCVPSGTYGHKEECPCYANLKTHEGGPKCP